MKLVNNCQGVLNASTNRWLVKKGVKIVFSDETRQPASTSLSIGFFLNWSRQLGCFFRTLASMTYDSLK